MKILCHFPEALNILNPFFNLVPRFRNLFWFTKKREKYMGSLLYRNLSTVLLFFWVFLRSTGSLFNFPSVLLFAVQKNSSLFLEFAWIAMQAFGQFLHFFAFYCSSLDNREIKCGSININSLFSWSSLSEWSSSSVLAVGSVSRIWYGGFNPQKLKWKCWERKRNGCFG